MSIADNANSFKTRQIRIISEPSSPRSKSEFLVIHLHLATRNSESV